MSVCGQDVSGHDGRTTWSAEQRTNTTTSRSRSRSRSSSSRSSEKRSGGKRYTTCNSLTDYFG